MRPAFRRCDGELEAAVMFIDARELTSGALVEADIAIVGAGAAGISLALDLIGTRLRVCLLESGGLELSLIHI